MDTSTRTQLFMNYNYHGDIDKDLICSICDEPFSTPVSCSRCGVSFCHICLSKWLEMNASRKTCPTCRNSLAEGMPNRSLANICDKLKVKCEFSKCSWVGQRTQLASHLPSCKYRVIPCDHDVHQLRAEVQQLRADVRQLRAENTQSQRELEQVRREQTAQKARIKGLMERIDSIVPPKEEDTLLSFLKKAAEKGDVVAQLHLGIYYQCEKNMKEEAVRWYRESANQGNADAQFRLGCYYYSNDEGGKADLCKAIKWYKRAAVKGSTEAQLKLGNCYFDGEGVKKNEFIAVKWYRKAAEQGDPDGQFMLGECYSIGDGVKRKSHEEAAKWYRKSADQGDAEAQYYLGKCYETGKGVAQNTEEAYNWFRKAAEKGNQDALSTLEEDDDCEDSDSSEEEEHRYLPYNLEDDLYDTY